MKLHLSAVVLLLAACAHDAQRSSAASQEPSAPPAPLAVSAEPAPAPQGSATGPAPSVVTLDVKLTPKPTQAATDAVVNLPWANAIGIESARGGVSAPSSHPKITTLAQPLRVGLRVPAAHVLNVALDGFTPQRVEGDGKRARLTLSSLVPELNSPKPGHHRLVWFVTDQNSALLHRGDGSPLVFSLDFELSSPDAVPTAASVFAASSAAPLVLQPRGTFNSIKPEEPLTLSVWHADAEQSLLLRIEGRNGAQGFLQLLRGSYELTGLTAGDYRFSLAAEGAAQGVDWTVTVNRDLDPAQAVQASAPAKGR